MIFDSADKLTGQPTPLVARSLSTPVALRGQAVGHVAVLVGGENRTVEERGFARSIITISVVGGLAGALIALLMGLLSRLVDDLRLLSLADAGQLSLQLVALEPRALLAEVAAMAAPRANERGVALLSGRPRPRYRRQRPWAGDCAAAGRGSGWPDHGAKCAWPGHELLRTHACPAGSFCTARCKLVAPEISRRARLNGFAARGFCPGLTLLCIPNLLRKMLYLCYRTYYCV